MHLKRKSCLPATLEVAEEISNRNKAGARLVKSLAGGLTTLLLTSPVMADTVVALKGTTDHARVESKNEVRLSVIDWSSREDRETVLQGFSALQQDHQEQAFIDSLNELGSKGYIFTGEATGYSIKYAVEHDDGSFTVLVVPGLKTKNRYMWDPASPPDAPGYTLLEVEWEGEDAIVHTSLDGSITQSENGLSLTEGDYSVFTIMKDATPYYLKEDS